MKVPSESISGDSATVQTSSRLPVKVGWACYWALLPGFLISNLEASLTNVALPAFGRSLHAEVSALGWIPLACQLPIASCSLLAGAWADRVGRRRVYLSGLMLLGLGLLLAIWSPSLEWLLVARVLQGIGCAGVVANGLAIVGEQFEPHELGKATGSLTALVGVGGIIAPPLGGFIATWLGWKGIFYLQIPVVLAGLVGVFRRVPANRPVKDVTPPLPIPSAVALAVSVGSCVTALWGLGRLDLWQLLGLALTSVLFFGLWRLLDGRALRPLLLPGVVQGRETWLISISAMSSAMAAVSFALPLLASARLGLEGLALGLYILPLPLALIGGSLLGGRFKDGGRAELAVAAGPGLYALGLLLVGAGMGAATSLEDWGPLGVTLVGLFSLGLGMGIFVVASNAQLLSTTVSSTAVAGAEAPMPSPGSLPAAARSPGITGTGKTSTGMTSTGALTGLMSMLRQLGIGAGVAWAGSMLSFLGGAAVSETQGSMAELKHFPVGPFSILLVAAPVLIACVLGGARVLMLARARGSE